MEELDDMVTLDIEEAAKFMDEYKKRFVETIRKEKESLKKQAEREAANIISQAKGEAEQLLSKTTSEAKSQASITMAEASEQAGRLKEQAQEESNTIVAKAGERAEQITSEAKQHNETAKAEAVRITEQARQQATSIAVETQQKAVLEVNRLIAEAQKEIDKTYDEIIGTARREAKQAKLKIGSKAAALVTTAQKLEETLSETRDIMTSRITEMLKVTTEVKSHSQQFLNTIENETKAEIPDA